MIVHQVYAQIADGVVRNVMVCDNYEMANYLARCTYGQAAFAVDCLQYPCQPGDRYRDGRFWRADHETGQETKIPYVPTQEQQVAALDMALTDSQLALAEQYEANLTLRESVTATQLALVEAFEKREV